MPQSAARKEEGGAVTRANCDESPETARIWQPRGWTVCPHATLDKNIAEPVVPWSKPLSALVVGTLQPGKIKLLIVWVVTEVVSI